MASGARRMGRYKLVYLQKRKKEINSPCEVLCNILNKNKYFSSEHV
jgi:hypothetical protein